MRAEGAIRVQELGHVTLFVRDVEASARFYRDVLGLIDRGRAKGGRLAFFSAGRHHHDLACQAVGPDAPAPVPGAPGLYHVAFKIGTTREDLDAARRALLGQGLAVFGDWQSGTSRSISTRDPDGHEIELYVELTRRGNKGSDAAKAAGRSRRDRRRIARAKPAPGALRPNARGSSTVRRRRADAGRTPGGRRWQTDAGQGGRGSP
ncbi:MAG: VOC family protein [Candidatus Rokubacteria bacterium]|nr:VOC family protein [Candidatus Rokubacteria bacterium]